MAKNETEKLEEEIEPPEEDEIDEEDEDSEVEEMEELEQDRMEAEDSAAIDEEAALEEHKALLNLYTQIKDEENDQDPESEEPKKKKRHIKPKKVHTHTYNQVATFIQKKFEADNSTFPIISDKAAKRLCLIANTYNMSLNTIADLTYLLLIYHQGPNSFKYPQTAKGTRLTEKKLTYIENQCKVRFYALIEFNFRVPRSQVSKDSITLSPAQHLNLIIYSETIYCNNCGNGLAVSKSYWMKVTAAEVKGEKWICGICTKLYKTDPAFAEAVKAKLFNKTDNIIEQELAKAETENEKQINLLAHPEIEAITGPADEMESELTKQNLAFLPKTDDAETIQAKEWEKESANPSKKKFRKRR